MTTLLSAKGLTRSYGKLRAVDGIDWEVRRGQRHALIGCNGAGKSTMLHLLAGTIRADAGTITFDGRDITRAPAARRARLGISRTFQTPALFDTLSGLDNLIVGALPHVRRRTTARERAERQLEALGLGDCASIIAGNLSHGRRRLLEIALALVSEPTVLLLDEPAAGLTEADLERLLHCLDNLPAELSVVLVEHHQDVVTAVADIVTVLHEGRILTAGKPDEVASHPDVIEVYLGAAVEP
ncbi:MAG TPA: ATP-binding cassette domain-containing protein [Stackebrandtia sp.]|jgi:branched-chain amino acid transport system ATP-binding protein|uniref:ABC transporter ATP-binding protein n=1 Tax=Stackebrandtia sp. TaxID=2023065 RepID=UPI002D344AFF|nr:ATP-binding cassette domain-containing protein [Stackebrandtia sp.]HZE39371.1 ATP-binding cassette domain-containing protein [Stackebrandtia sp.]